MDSTTSAPLGLIAFYYVYVFAVGALEWVGELVTSRKWLMGLLAIVLFLVISGLTSEVERLKQRIRKVEKKGGEWSDRDDE